jgi:glutamyl-tRNA synthetase
VRGDEHFMNAVKQLVLYRALDAPPPLFAHIPLILGTSGKKLSKRDATTNLLDYRDRGYPADAVFNYISLLGWGFSGERDIFSRAEMVEVFRLENVGKAGAQFDEEKLLALCGHYMRAMPADRLVEAVRPFLVDSGAVPRQAFDTHPRLVQSIVACHQERMRIYSELPDKVRYFFADRLELDAAAQKNLRKHEAAPAWLTAYADRLEGTDLPPSYPADRADADAESSPFTSPAQIEEQARALADELGLKFGHLVHPIRAAITGTDKGPGLFDIVYLLGKERCVARLRAHASRT